MNLPKYISDLLYRYECVIVPGFGGFVMNTKPAIISPYSKTFYPPHKLITFNSHLVHNDGLLANYIASVDQIPYDSALNFINFEVNAWIETLRKTDLTLEDIGFFTLEKDSLIFEPQTEVNYLTEAYGLSSFVAPEIKRETYKKEVEELEKKVPILVTERSRKYPNYLKYAAIFLVGLSVLGYTAGSLYKKHQQKQEIATSLERQHQIEQKIEKATFIVTEALPSLMVDATLEKKPYHIILGAFRYPENATKQVNYLLEKGYNARILGINKHGLTQVAINSYENYQDAVNDLIEVRNSEDKDAWLLTQDL
ncbi:SPOR domain-containing protein [Flavobacteriaceae bacterium F08102]|nr:SPOR domain-containing protein [Flavobacteriaceae bacterium F08102]